MADEPTGNVDDTMAKRLMYLFLELNKLGTTVVVATHNTGLVKNFHFPQLHLANGHLKEIGATESYSDMASKIFKREGNNE